MMNCPSLWARVMPTAASAPSTIAIPISQTYQGFAGYFVVDARARYKVDENWSVSLGVDNLNNDKYFLFHPFPQRTFVMSVHYQQ
jgi:outer membrane receptor protein involved in Fe transport